MEELDAICRSCLIRWSSRESQLEQVCSAVLLGIECETGNTFMAAMMATLGNQWQPYHMVAKSPQLLGGFHPRWERFAKILQEADLSTRAKLLLDCQEDQFPMYTVKLITEAFTNDIAADLFIRLTAFTLRCLSPTVRRQLIDDVTLDQQSFLLRAAAWVHTPLVDLSVPSGVIHSLGCLKAFVADVDDEDIVAQNFVSTVRDRFYSAPALALALTDQRELFDTATYNFFAQSFTEWPALTVQTVCLAKQPTSTSAFVKSRHRRRRHCFAGNCINQPRNTKNQAL